MGANIINDVSGLTDKAQNTNDKMLSLLENSSALYVLMHSLDIPANPKNTLPEKEDPLPLLCQWLENKLELLDKRKISFHRIFFDPGIGFGKNALQSLHILKNLEIFKKYPVQLLVGHSRKSFMKNFNLPLPTTEATVELDTESKTTNKRMEPTVSMATQRDPHTLGISMKLIQKGVDVLRIHNPELHIQAHQAWNHVAS